MTKQIVEGGRQEIEVVCSEEARAIVVNIGLLLLNRASMLPLAERCYIAEKLMHYAGKLRGGKRGKL